jgi:beta-lactamase class A
MIDKIKKDFVLLKNPLMIVLMVISISLGIGLGLCLNTTPKEPDTSEQVRLGAGVFTNPLLECEVAKDAINSPKVYFDTELKTMIKKINDENKPTDISLYYRDLNNGPVISINDDEFFMPASLLKVPVMMSYFKHAEKDPSILLKKIVFTENKSVEFTPNFLPEKTLEMNHVYTVEELIDRMITYSDNQALALLWPGISMDEYVDLYKALGVDPRVVTDPSHGISVKEYSRFFRILYNSSYISHDYSEKALETLSKSTFDDGIKKYIPNNIKVAGKFGERDLGDGMRQLHECAIVYYPNHPYLLCIMTKGTDQKVLANTISEISRFIFTKINNQYLKP